MTLVTAFKILLHRYATWEDIVLGTVTSQHNRAELRGMIGYFLNTLALRSDLVEILVFENYLNEYGKRS